MFAEGSRCFVAREVIFLFPLQSRTTVHSRTDTWHRPSLIGRVGAIAVKPKVNWKGSPRFFNSPIPFSLESGTVPSVPATMLKLYATFTASFYSTLDTAAAALLIALSACHIAEIDVRLRVRGSGEEIKLRESGRTPTKPMSSTQGSHHPRECLHETLTSANKQPISKIISSLPPTISTSPS